MKKKTKSSKKVKIGTESMRKGKKFEDDIADIYRLLGGKVFQNIEICNKKVDIFVKFKIPGSSSEHKIIVECKNEERPVNQNVRIMQFKGILEVARKSGEADSAEIITRVPWSEQAKGFALKSDINLLTYKEKISSLMDFSPYLKNMIDRFEKGKNATGDDLPLSKYFVTPILEEDSIENKRKKIKDNKNFFKSWINGENNNLVVFGEYGIGKTCLSKKIAYDFAKIFLNDPNNRIPLLFNLGDFTKSMDIESYVSSFLDRQCDVSNPRFKLFNLMNHAGLFILIFDGLDEMASRVHSDILELNLNEIEKISNSPKAKTILTSRIEYFINLKEERKCLNPQGELLPTREIKYERVYLLPWNEKQINEFLKKRVKSIKVGEKDWTYYRDTIHENPSLEDLSKRPVLLEMIIKTLPILVAKGTPLNRPNIFETYLLGELKRQKIKKGRKFIISEENRMILLQELALDFIDNDIYTTTYVDAIKYIKQIVKPPRDELEECTREFLSCSFLNREGDNYKFSHRSIMEYLAARALFTEINNDNLDKIARRKFPKEIIEFLSEFNVNKITLWNGVIKSRAADKKIYQFLGANCITILSKNDEDFLKGKDISNTYLYGADLSYTNLNNCNFNGTSLINTNLVGALLLKNDIKSAFLKNITIILGVYSEDEKLKKENIDEYRDHLFNELEEAFNKHGVEINICLSQFQENCIFSRFQVTIPDNDALFNIEEILKNNSYINNYSIYSNEHEKLLTKITKPSGLIFDPKSFLLGEIKIIIEKKRIYL